MQFTCSNPFSKRYFCLEKKRYKCVIFFKRGYFIFTFGNIKNALYMGDTVVIDVTSNGLYA